MKKLSFYFFLLILLILVGFNSCTIEKRHYQPGYYVKWHNVNRKSKTNTEIESKKLQETVCEEKIVVENNVEKIEDFIQPTAIQEFEPVYASNDVNSNNILIINSSKQKNTFYTNTKKVASEINESVIKKKTTKTLEITKGAKKTHWAAIVGFVTSILAWAFMFGYIYSLNFWILSAIFFWGSILLGISAIIISIIAIKRIKANPEKYKGKGIAIAGLVIGTLYAFIAILFNLFILMITGTFS